MFIYAILAISGLPPIKKLLRFQLCNLKIRWFWTFMNFDCTKSMIWQGGKPKFS